MSTSDVWLRVGGMWCVSCARAVEAALERHDEVHAVRASPTTGTTHVELTAALDEQRLIDAVRRAGYSAERWSLEPDDTRAAKNSSRVGLRFAVAVLFGMWAMLLQVMHYLTDLGSDALFVLGLAGAFSTPVVWFCGIDFHRAAWRTLRQGVPGMDFLVSAGAILAWTVSVFALFRSEPTTWFDTASMLITFLLGARLLEHHLRQRGLATLRRAMGTTPDLADRVRGTEVDRVEATTLSEGERIRWRTGTTLAVDGIVVKGEGRVDGSALTGESVPKRCRAGDWVFAGTQLVGGELELQVERPVGHRRIDEVRSSVERAVDQRLESQRVAERFAERLVPVIAVVAFASGLWAWFGGLSPSESLLRAVSVLVVTCPCALSLAGPMALAFAVRGAARMGIVFREPDAIERAADVDTVVFDKTGTLTEPLAGMVQRSGELDALRIAASAEWGIAHPVASAFRHAALDAGKELERGGERRLVTGQGVEWRHDGHLVRVGRRAFALGDSEENDDRQYLHVVRDGIPIGVFDRTERIYSDVQPTLERLREHGFGLFVSSGDQKERVAEVAAALSIDHYDAQQSPLEKAERVASLEASGRRVAFMGDGVNDTPALARAHLGVAVANASRQALAAAPVAIMHGSVARLEDVLMMARRARRIVRANLRWAVLYNALAVPLAAAGFVAPVIAPLAMVASSFSVTLSSLRLVARTSMSDRSPRVKVAGPWQRSAVAQSRDRGDQ